MTTAEGKLAATRFDGKTTLRGRRQRSMTVGRRELRAITGIMPIVRIINGVKRPVPKVNSQYGTKEGV